MRNRATLAALGAALLTAPALAQVPAGNSAPQPVPFVDTIPPPRDVAYPGVMTLDVDVTDTERGIFRVKQTIPVVQSGRMALLYPKFLPGNHAPRGEIEKVAGTLLSNPVIEDFEVHVEEHSVAEVAHGAGR